MEDFKQEGIASDVLCVYIYIYILFFFYKVPSSFSVENELEETRVIVEENFGDAISIVQ